MALSDVALLLGPVAFQGFEIPDHIGFGGEQRLAVHDLPGGQRVIDTLGAAPADIAWSGVFSGADATQRARTLDTLRVQGAVLTLSWDVFFYSVVIRSFEASYHNAAWVPYQLRVTVLLDAAQPVAGLAETLVADALGDAASAAGFATAAGVDVSSVQTALAQPGATVLQTAAYVSASAAIGVAQNAVQSGLDASGASLAVYAQGLGGAPQVSAMIVQAGNAAYLSSANTYLGRLALNMQNASS
jgi:hypothetical protein